MEQSNIELLSQLENKIAGYRKRLEESGSGLSEEQWTDFVESAIEYDRLLNKLFFETVDEDSDTRPELPEAEGTGKAVLLSDEDDRINLSSFINSLKNDPFLQKRTLFIVNQKGTICRNDMEFQRFMQRLTPKARQLEKELDEIGKKAFPDYNKGFISLYKQYFPYGTYTDPMADLYAPQNPYPAEKSPLPVRVRDYLKVANWAYEGKHEKVDGIRSLSFEELPELFRKYYNEAVYEESGYVVHAPASFHVWFGMEGDDTVLIGFAGTELTNLPTVRADIQQLVGYSAFYRMAIGVVSLMLQHYPSHNVRVIGHSLGGGLTQFSVAANIWRAQGRLTGIGFNSAGLSSQACRSLESNLPLATCSISHYITPHDLVSRVGNLLGSKIRLPEKGNSGHGTADIAPCVDEYIRMEKQLEEIKVLVLAGLIKEPGGDFPFSNVHIPCIIKDNISVPHHLWTLCCAPEDESVEGMWDKIHTLYITMPLEWINSLLGHWNSRLDAGILPGVNGNTFTVLNRLLVLFNRTLPRKENIYFTAFYGKYGIDADAFQKQAGVLLADFWNSHYLNAGKFKEYSQKAIDNLANAYKEEVVAWKTVLDEFLPSCGLPQLGDSFPENDFLVQYRKFKGKRKDLFRPEWLHAPFMTDDDKNVFFDAYRTLIVEYGLKIYQHLKKQDAASVTITEEDFREKVERWFEGFRKAACTKA